VVGGAEVEVADAVRHHLLQVREPGEAVQNLHAGERLIRQKLQFLYRCRVQGAEQEAKYSLVLVSQKVLLVPHMVIADQT